MNKSIICFLFLLLAVPCTFFAQDSRLEEVVEGFLSEVRVSSIAPREAMDNYSSIDVVESVVPLTMDSPHKIGGGVGFRLSFPEGMQFTAAVSFLPELTARAGFGFIPSTSLFNRDIALRDFNYKNGNQTNSENFPDVRTSLKLSNFQGHLLLDYHPFRNSFRLTGGFYLGRLKLKGDLALIDHKTKKPITFDNEIFDPSADHTITFYDASNSQDKVVIKPSDKLSLDMSVNWGRVFQPYLGIGGGYNVSKTPVSFVWDIGFVVAGKAKVSSSNVIEGDLNNLLDYSKEVQQLLYYTQILPVASVGISVKLF